MTITLEETFETAGMILFDHFDIRTVTAGWPLSWLWRARRSTASLNSLAAPGSTRYSRTPRRMALRMSSGSRPRAQATTTARGAERLSRSSRSGSPRWSARYSTRRTSGWSCTALRSKSSTADSSPASRARGAAATSSRRRSPP